MPKNRLADETSPYLLQHAENPVDWYAWSDEALRRARDENKPIFLSIGYSSCHWCHVMAHESFESAEIAEFMNDNFVNIKVDREERPDIDDVYQKACQMATGQGGWPLSVFLTPDQKPFHVGTYYPPLDSYGRPGFGSLCRQLAQAWKERPGDVDSRAGEFVGVLRRLDEKVTARSEPLQQLSQSAPGDDGAGQQQQEGRNLGFDRTTLDEAAMNLYDGGDSTYGGFGSAPKFPNAACISFMFRYAAVSGHHQFLKFGLRTLDKMARGGIFDQIGGGFHRYSTDARWLVPHFEKMLYDNALIPVNYAEAYQITKDSSYLEVMKKTLDFVLRDMGSPESDGFCSAYDADSEGAEGRYYTWKKSEVRRVLGEGAGADLFCLYYDVTDGGNWEGETILCNNVPLSTAAFRLGMSEEEARASLESSCALLLAARSGTRQPPGLDQKVLVSWNALFVTALATGYRVTGDQKYLDAAVRCVSFIESELIMYEGAPRGEIRASDDNTAAETGHATTIIHHDIPGDNAGGGTVDAGDEHYVRLLRTYKDGRAKIEGYLEDYAYLASALLDLFEVKPDPGYLRLALRLGRTILDEFWDDAGCVFYMTGRTSHERLIVRPQNLHDLSVPSGNSVATRVMMRLYHMSGARRFLDVYRAAIRAHAQSCAENPFAFGYMLNLMSDVLAGCREITILDGADGAMRDRITRSYLPDSILVTVPDADSLGALSGYPFFTGKVFDAEKTTVYVCKDSVCSLPMTDAGEVDAALGLSDAAFLSKV